MRHPIPTQHVSRAVLLFFCACGLHLSAWAAQATVTVTGASPNNGSTNGGTSVTVTGSGFASGAVVLFGGVAASNVSVANDTQLTAITPVHAAGTVDVVITNPNGQSGTGAQIFTYNPAPAPTLTSVSPATGGSNGGTTVTLTGTGFATGASVSFGGAAATNVSVKSDTRLTAATPAGAAALVDVVVTNPDGQSVTLAGAFTYTAAPQPTVASITPATGPSTGGTSVTIAGTGFAAGASVALGGAAASKVSVVNDTSITALTPQHQAGTVDVLVTNPDGQTGTLAGAFTYYTAGEGLNNWGDLSIVTTSLPSGQQDAAYGATVAVSGGSFATSGLTYIRFGAADLPPGLSMNGLTGMISGSPGATGTFNVTLTATDLTDNDKASTILPLIVYAKNSTFKFDTTALSDGTVSASYGFALAVSGAPSNGTIKFSAAGLPSGLQLDSGSGVISGAPTQPGTFIVWIYASAGGESISLNLPLVVMPAGSTFRWRTYFLPAAFLNQPYSPSAPPVSFVTQDPGPESAVYSSSGLPPGLSYSALGQFSGTPLATGIFPVTFTATDSVAGNQIVFVYDFVVLPPNGGDTNSLPLNLWLKKAAFKRGDPGKDGWTAQWLYNADRRLTVTPQAIYDATTDPLGLSLGAIPEVSVLRASLIGARPKFACKTPAGVVPAVAVKLDESAQTLALMEKGLTIDDRYKSTLRNTVKLGARTYRLDLYFDDKGKFTPALGYRRTAFVVAAAKVNVKGATKDSLSFSLMMGNPLFKYPADSGSKAVRLRVLNAAGAAVAEKDFTPIVGYSTAVDSATGTTVYKLKSGKDGTPPLGRFSYDSKSGKMLASLSGLTLTGLLGTSEEHVTVEIDIGETQYFTSVTLFAPKTGMYSTKMP